MLRCHNLSVFLVLLSVIFSGSCQAHSICEDAAEGSCAPGHGTQELAFPYNPTNKAEPRPCSAELRIGSYRYDMLLRLSKTWHSAELRSPLVVLIAVDKNGQLVKVPGSKPGFTALVTRSSHNEGLDQEALKTVAATKFAPLPYWYTGECAHLLIDFGAVRAVQIFSDAGDDQIATMTKAVALQIAITAAGGCEFSKYRTSEDLFPLLNASSSKYADPTELCQAIRAFHSNEFIAATRYIDKAMGLSDKRISDSGAGIGGGAPIATRLPVSAMGAMGNIGPYRKKLITLIAEHWKPKFPNQNIIVIITISRDGSLLSTNIFQSSGLKQQDKAALEAVMATQFEPLPEWFKGHVLTFKIELSKVEAVQQ